MHLWILKIKDTLMRRRDLYMDGTSWEARYLLNFLIVLRATRTPIGGNQFREKVAVLIVALKVTGRVNVQIVAEEGEIAGVEVVLRATRTGITVIRILDGVAAEVQAAVAEGAVTGRGIGLLPQHLIDQDKLLLRMQLDQEVLFHIGVQEELLLLFIIDQGEVLLPMEDVRHHRIILPDIDHQ